MISKSQELVWNCDIPKNKLTCVSISWDIKMSQNIEPVFCGWWTRCFSRPHTLYSNKNNPMEANFLVTNISGGRAAGSGTITYISHSSIQRNDATRHGHLFQSIRIIIFTLLYFVLYITDCTASRVVSNTICRIIGCRGCHGIELQGDMNWPISSIHQRLYHCLQLKQQLIPLPNGAYFFAVETLSANIISSYFYLS